VAQRVVLGQSTARIANDLGTPERTVSKLLSIVYRKVGSDHNGLAKVLSTDTDGVR
jgi:DNA-binding CsgD family transcriptional regulator